MRRIRKQIVRAARMLEDPTPVFVSQVGAGANQTPFKVVKSDETGGRVAGRIKEATTMAKTAVKTKDKPVAKAVAKPAPKTEAPVRKRSKVAATTPAPAAKADARKVDIHQMFFPIEHYVDENAVKSYLTENGYADYEIENDAFGFTVKGADADAFEGDLKEIENDNITLTVGYLKDGTAKAADPDETEDEDEEVEAAAKGDDEDEEETDEDADKDADDEDEEDEDAAAKTEATEADDAEAEAKAMGDKKKKPMKGKGKDKAKDGEEAAAKTDEPAVVPLADAVAAFDAALATAKGEVAAVAANEVPGDTTQKFDSVTDVLKYMDDVPPGFYDLMTAFSIVTRSAMGEKDYKRIKKAASEMGDYVVSLAQLFETKDEASKDEKSEKTAEQQGNELSSKVDALIRAGLTSTKKKAAPAADKTGETEDDKAKAKKSDASKETTDEKPDPMAAIMARLDALGERVEQIAVGKTAEAGSGGKASVPERKGEDDGAEPVNKTDKPEKVVKYLDAVDEDPLIRGMFGLPRAVKRDRQS